MDTVGCTACQGKGIGRYGRVIRLGPHSHAVRELVHRAKYAGDWSLAHRMARLLWEKEDVRSLLPLNPILIPVPLHFVRRWKRGYNVPELLCRRLLRLAHRHGPGKLALSSRQVRRIRNTRSQVSLESIKARQDNIRGAFSCRHGHRLCGRHVVVVDDVMTTGATLLEVARILAPHKPASLSALVVSVAQRGIQTPGVPDEVTPARRVEV